MAEAESAFEVARLTLSKGLREAAMRCESALIDLRSHVTRNRGT